MPRSSPSAARRSALALGTAALLMGSAIAGAAKEPPLVLQGSSSWNLHYDDESCQLIHTFGAGDDKVSLELHQFGPGNSLTIIAVGKRLKYSGKAAPTVTEFGPDGTPYENHTALVATLADGEGVVETLAPFLAVDPARKAEGAQRRTWSPTEDRKPLVVDHDAEARITQLRLGGPISRELVFALGPMDKPMDAMRVCLDSLVTHWGIDAAAHHSLTRRAAPSSDPADWLKYDDLPSEMKQKHTNGIYHVRFLVSPEGKPTDCKIQSTFGSDFAQSACRSLLQRARFTPALDATRKPITSFYIQNESWVTFTTTRAVSL